MALHDAAFAIAAGRADDCGERAPAAEPFAQVAVGEPPSRLLREAARRLTALAALPHPVHPDRERPVPVNRGAAGPHRHPARRTARSHSTVAVRVATWPSCTGRGVYTATVEVARMLAEGVLECPAEPLPIPVLCTARRPGRGRPAPAGAAPRSSRPRHSRFPPLCPAVNRVGSSAYGRNTEMTNSPIRCEQKQGS
ncbi:hypothetical protein SALBM311S_03489 [Streptomyces alboniger]